VSFITVTIIIYKGRKEKSQGDEKSKQNKTCKTTTATKQNKTKQNKKLSIKNKSKRIPGSVV
jgi:hypothetical protein